MKRLGLLMALVAAGACAGHENGALPPETALSAAGAKDLGPVYSPDGSRIAYLARSTDSTSGFVLWTANADGTAPVKVMTDAVSNQALLWSPDGGQLLTASSRFGLVHAVVVPAQGGTPRRLSKSPGLDFPAGWYPGGDRVAYFATTAGGSVSAFAVSLKSGTIAPMVPSEHRPYIGLPSPDGTHLAYNVFYRSSSTIWVADGDGTNPRQLTTEGFEGIFDSNAWSPDGKEILYLSNRTGTNDLWVAPIDGRPLRQLTRDVRNDQDGVWSPDGRWVAFRSDRGRQWNVWVVSAAGGDARRITDDPQGENGLAWRPRSSTLAFVRTATASSIWAMDLASGTERQLTPDSVRTAGFWLSPDGSQLDYVVDRGGGVQELAVMPLAGGASRTLLPAAGSIQSPTWSPDGTKIAFLSDRGGLNHVWAVDVAGGAPRALTSWPSSEISLFWSGDGSMVYFVSDHDSKLSDLWKVPAAGGDAKRVTTDGSVTAITGRTGKPDLYASTLSPRAGQFAIERFRPDGRRQIVWDKTNSFLIGYDFTSPSGDSLVAQIEQPGGVMRSMIISADGGGGRVILDPNESAGLWSPDGRYVTFQVVAEGGETDIGLYDVATGAKRVLMHTPENEGGQEISRDGKTLVFNRGRTESRIFTVDLTKLMAAPAK